MIHHGDTETPSKLLHEELTEKIIGAAIEVHRTYLKRFNKRVGLILNFYTPTLVRGGIVRKVI
jgi:hypothetical protein